MFGDISTLRWIESDKFYCDESSGCLTTNFHDLPETHPSHRIKEVQLIALFMIVCGEPLAFLIAPIRIKRN